MPDECVLSVRYRFFADPRPMLHDLAQIQPAEPSYETLAFEMTPTVHFKSKSFKSKPFCRDIALYPTYPPKASLHKGGGRRKGAGRFAARPFFWKYFMEAGFRGMFEIPCRLEM